MPESRPDPERILLRLEWTVIRRLDGALHGNYRTLFRGVGLDLADLREDQHDDDVRHIDWNVTARLQTPYVRQYVEDREVTAWFVLDLSPSQEFGTVRTRKLLNRPPPRRTPLTDLTALLEGAVLTCRRRSLVFVVSDFISTPGWGA